MTRHAALDPPPQPPPPLSLPTSPLRRCGSAGQTLRLAGRGAHTAHQRGGREGGPAGRRCGGKTQGTLAPGYDRPKHPGRGIKRSRLTPCVSHGEGRQASGRLSSYFNAIANLLTLSSIKDSSTANRPDRRSATYIALASTIETDKSTSQAKHQCSWPMKTQKQLSHEKGVAEMEHKYIVFLH